MTLLFPNNDWLVQLAPLFAQPATHQLFQKIDQLYHTQHVLPKETLVFNALTHTPYARTRVVVIGQDPYPAANHAMGMSFSVPPQSDIPYSLQNIFKERYTDIGLPPSTSGDLTHWADQGVLLLNASLTVEANQRNSHADIGWKPFTDAIISVLNQKTTPLVYWLWGRFARNYRPQIAPKPTTLILEAPHPSPFSANYGFFGSKPFSKTNAWFAQHHEPPIDWRN